MVLRSQTEEEGNTLQACTQTAVTCGGTNAWRCSILVAGIAAERPKLLIQVWCQDFVGDGAVPGSCCDKDDTIALGWCLQPANRAHPQFNAACTPSNSSYGMTNWYVDERGRSAGSGRRHVLRN